MNKLLIEPSNIVAGSVPVSAAVIINCRIVKTDHGIFERNERFMLKLWELNGK